MYVLIRYLDWGIAMSNEAIIGIAIVGFFVWLLFKLFGKRDRSRIIPEDVKRKVLERFNGECACCTEKNVLDIHHRKEFADGGENTYENLVALCPNHHALITRNGK